MVSVDEILGSIAEQAASMNRKVAEAVEAYRKENDALRKKTQALESALLAKAAGGAETPSGEQGSVKPAAFADHLASGVVNLTVCGRELSIHRSILQSIPFFEAKLEHWSDEAVQLPGPVSEPALHTLLKRLYLGAPLPAGDPAMCAQALSLAKYWLMDDVVPEMVAELLRTATRADIPVLESLADSFGLPELSAAIGRLRKAATCSSEDLDTMVQRALEGDGQAQGLSTATLEGHPEAAAVLRKRFEKCDFFDWSQTVDIVFDPGISCKVRKTVHRVRVRGGFPWFWAEAKRAKLLDTDLPFISGMLIRRLNERTGHQIQDFYGSFVSDTTPATLATALAASGGIGSDLPGACLDMVNAASEHLRAPRRLPPADLRELLAMMPKVFVDWNRGQIDAAVAGMVTGLPYAAGAEVVRLLNGRVGDVGERTAAALQEWARS